MKKKRIVLLLVLAVAVYVAIRYSILWSLAGVVLLVLLLGGLQVLHLVLAHRGIAALRALGGKYHWQRMAEKARENLGQDEELTFVALGDTRNKTRTAEQVYRAAATEQAALVFHTGDIVRHGTAKEFLKNHVPLLDILEPAPLFCVPGNHERGARRDFAAFKELYGDDRFAFEVGNCLFVGVNNSGRKRMSKDCLAYLDEHLGSSEAAHKFVFYHIPPAFFEATFVKDERRRGFEKRADESHQLLVRHGVEEVFMAHIHGYASEEIDGVRYTLTAGGGAPLSSRLASEGQCHHYVVLKVRGDDVERAVVRHVGGEWVRGD